MSNNKIINVGEIDISGEGSVEEVSTEVAQELSLEELANRERMMRLLFARFTNSNKNWKRRLKGFPSNGKIVQPKSWYNGKLISKEEHDKLPLEEVLEYNNKITGRKYK